MYLPTVEIMMRMGTFKNIITVYNILLYTARLKALKVENVQLSSAV